jgi:D-glutamate cyclase
VQPPDLSPRALDLVAKMVGENIDRVTSVELRSYGVVPKVYAAAREQIGFPLSMAAAMLLKERVTPGSNVLVLTGFPIMPYELVETDGPVGAAAIARSLNVAFSARPVLPIEPAFLGSLWEACRAAGLSPYEHVDDCRGVPAAVVAPFTMDASEADAEADILLDALQPTAVVAVERVGRNRAGLHHSGRGVPLNHLTAKMDCLFERATERGIATIGIGDLGNELGMGSLRATVEAATAFGTRCLCPCESGMACDVPSDVPVVAGVSNWGAYGVCAALAYLMDDSDILHSPALEEEILRACAAGGAIDGPTGRPIGWVDGIATDYHVRLIAQLHDLIRYPARLSGLYRSAYEKSAELDDTLRPSVLRDRSTSSTPITGG